MKLLAIALTDLVYCAFLCHKMTEWIEDSGGPEGLLCHNS